MTKQRIINARLITGDTVIEGAAVEIEAGRIAAIVRRPGVPRAGDIDLGGAYLAPGFLDIHCHPEPLHPGKDLRDYAVGLSRELAGLGVTGIFWTVADLPIPQLHQSAASLRALLDDPPEACRILGVHFEGPYIAPAAKGAFNEKTIFTPRRLPLDKLLRPAGPHVRYLSLSPEITGGLALITECRRRGIRVGIGHTAADADTCRSAVRAGAGAVIHTFNNTFTYPMKETGVRGVTVDEFGLGCEDLLCELICDGIHVDPVLVKMLRKAKGPAGVVLVTDSIVGGVVRPDGYVPQWPGHPFVIHGNAGRLAGGLLAGSALTMAGAFRNYVEFGGASLPEAVRATSLNAARFMGLDGQFGRIAPGCSARFAVFDETLRLCMARLDNPV